MTAATLLASPLPREVPADPGLSAATRGLGPLRRFWPEVFILGGALALCLHLWSLMKQGHQDELARSRQLAQQRAAHLVQATEHELDATLHSLDFALIHLRDHYAGRPRQLSDAIRQVMAAYPQGLVLGVAIDSLDGRAQQASASRFNAGVALDPSLAGRHAPGSDQLDIGPLRQTDGDNQERYILISRPVYRGDTRVAVIGLALRTEVLSRQLAALQGQSQDALTLLGAGGEVVVHSQGEQAEGLPLPGGDPARLAVQREPGIWHTRSARDGRPLLVAWHAMPRWSLTVAAAIDEAQEYTQLLAQQAQAERHAGGLVALALCFAAGVAALTGRLRHAQARSTAMFQRCGLPMLLVDPLSNRLVEANAAAADFYGHARRAMRGMPLTRILAAPGSGPADAASWRDGMRQRHVRADGSACEIEIRCGELALGPRTLMYCVVQDITDRCAAQDAAAAQAARLAALLDTASDGIHVLDEDGHLVLYSPSFIGMLGYSDEQARTLHVRDWDVDGVAKDIREVVRQRMIRPHCYEVRLRRKDGHVVDAEIASRGIVIGGQRYLYASARDITERKTAEQQLRVAAAAFEAQEGIIVTDHDNVVLRVNRAFTEITGYTAAEMVGRRPSVLASGLHDAAYYARMWRSIRREGHWKGEIYNRRKNGQVYPEWLTITAVRAADGHITHHVGMLTDITERKAAEREVNRLAFFDPLTQLPNRRLLYQRLQHALDSAAHKRRRGAALFIDLDDFKTLNDTRGHATGDLLLVQLARRLRASVGDENTVARLGGDEFVVLLEDIDGADEAAAASVARRMAQKMLAAVAEPCDLEGQPTFSTASIGIAMFDGHSTGVDEVLKRADLAMYEAKAKGRNGVRFFDPRMQDLAARRVRLETELRTALQCGELVLYYQPQVDRHGRICGAETLVRWQHPERGLLLPGEFIEVAERAGLITALGVTVLEQACAQLVRWSRQPGLRDLTLAVNVSALQFGEEDFVDAVRRILQDTGADPHRLELELTESALVSDVDAVVAKMRALKAMGVHLALDDFGTGYSSLSYLSRLPLDQLKIDRSFVKGIGTDHHGVVICAATINLAHSLSLQVVAEGVETEAQRHVLTTVHRCDRMQGYLFGRPVPAGAFAAAVEASLQRAAAQASARA